MEILFSLIFLATVTVVQEPELTGTLGTFSRYCDGCSGTRTHGYVRNYR
jgi:hypothetical protein